MMLLIVGLILFLGVHLLPTSPELARGIAGAAGNERLQSRLFAAVTRGPYRHRARLPQAAASPRKKPDTVEFRRSGRGISRPG